LTYGDGDPWFYLGDTAWEIVWKSTMDQVRHFISDRRRKGFSVLQMTSISHMALPINRGVTNRDGQSVFLDSDYGKLNPRFFDYLDTIISMANDSGLAVSLVPLWASFNILDSSNHWHPRYLTNDESLLLADYIGARYAGHNVIWIVTADDSYKTPEKQAFWPEFAHRLRAASGPRHLMTIHPQGWTSSIDFFDNNTDWIDFQMYQSSHTIAGAYTWFGGQTAYKLSPPKPVVDGEAVYEDLHNNLWEPGAPIPADGDTSRILPQHIRQASYEAIFSGAKVGMTYGANGIWQWHDTGYYDILDARLYAMQAIDLPGSTQMSVLKTLMTTYHWYRLNPRQELIRGLKSVASYMPVVADTDHVLLYFPMHTTSVMANLSSLGGSVSFRWIDPATGETIHLQHDSLAPGTDLNISPPDTNDWLLVAEPAKPSIVRQSISDPVSLSLGEPVPNPCHGALSLPYSIPDDGIVTLELYNVAGQQVVNRRVTAIKGSSRISVDGLRAGAYLYRVTYAPYSGTGLTTSGRVVSLGE
jgi:hypothetical protein